MDQSPPKEPRPPINLRIKFRSESIEQFIERYAVDVSRGGIFIRTREPLAVGTHLKLDFQFQNGGALMTGDGTVVWIREIDPNRTSVPPGMGVRFDKLTPESQVVLEQLLVEKAKRERGGVPGSASQGAGGMAVRRPSSMFSVLDSSITTTPGTTADKSAPTAAPATEPNPVAAAPAVAAPVAAASTGYRPLGTARNPFSAVTGAGTGASFPSASASPSPSPSASSPDVAAPGSARATGSQISQNPNPDPAAPFDDLSDEPTQIASRLPSFLTTDEEATTVGSLPFAEAPRPARQPAIGTAPGASTDGPKSPPSEPRRFQPERKTGTQATIPPAAESSRQKQSLDQAPPFGGALTGAPTKEASRQTAKDVATTGAGPGQDRGQDRATEKTPLPITSPGILAVEAPRLSTSAPAATVSGTPIATDVSEARPPVSSVASVHGAVADPAGTTPAPTAPARATPAGAKAFPTSSATRAPTTQGANVHPVQSVKGRSPAAMVGLTVIVLGASAIFLFRFFGSQATEPVSPSSAPAGVVATGEPSTVTGDPAVPAPEGTNPTAASPPTGANADPSGASPPAAGASPLAAGASPAAGAQPPTPEPAAAARPAEPPPTKAEDSAPDSTPRAPSGAVKSNEPSASGKKGGKTKSARGPRDTDGSPPATASAAVEPKPAQPAAEPGAEPTAAEVEATVHQIRITSRPAGADVTLDGQTVGKTPYSIGIADVSAPHFIAVRKDGFEPFEQLISASSTWTKTKASKGKPALMVLKINAKLKEAGGAGAAATTAGGETKPSMEPPGPEGNTAPKIEGPKLDRPLPPSDERAPAESPP